jgi:hypothetical protein
MSNVTIQLNEGTAISIDAIIHRRNGLAVLISIEGEVHGKVNNCALIPLHTVPKLIAALELVALSCKA